MWIGTYILTVKIREEITIVKRNKRFLLTIGGIILPIVTFIILVMKSAEDVIDESKKED